MNRIADYINNVNKKNQKALSIYLTSGYPDRKNFTELAVKVLDAGADLIELGIPFSDPLADGPVIQKSSYQAIQNGVNTNVVLNYVKEIRSASDKPIILMGYANPINTYGIRKFFDDAKEAGADGLIVPDIPVEEYESFYYDTVNGLDKILLTTPTSPDERIKKIDKLSSGFVYCVSVTGTTGVRKSFPEEVLSSLKRTYSLIKKNKMLVGFGISSPENIKQISPYCDGVIVGSAVIKKLAEANGLQEVEELISSLKKAC